MAIFVWDSFGLLPQLQSQLQFFLSLAVSLNVEHELTRQRKWDKQETQEYMRHFNALKLDSLTSVPPLALVAATGNAREKKNLQMFG